MADSCKVHIRKVKSQKAAAVPLNTTDQAVTQQHRAQSCEKASTLLHKAPGHKRLNGDAVGGLEGSHSLLDAVGALLARHLGAVLCEREMLGQ